jgi:hypothetical protein
MLLIRLICAKTSRHLVDIAHSHEFFDDLTRFFDIIEIISLTLFREQNAFDDDFDVNEIEEKIHDVTLLNIFFSNEFLKN